MFLYYYDPWLVGVSAIVSVMAAFTGLSLTRGIGGLVEPQRHLRIAMAAFALGGGIWSMHFVAMLAMRFPVPIHYDLLQTTASALIAILLAGLALLLMHFGPRSRVRIAVAGIILGAGIVTMHYVGIEAIEGSRPVYAPFGFVVVGALAATMGIAALGLAYGRRTLRNIVLATLVLGASVVVVHFSAMYWTGFTATAARGAPQASAMSNAQIALVVMLASFVISGGFLLTGASVLNRPADTRVRKADTAVPEPAVSEAAASTLPAQPSSSSVASETVRVPFERDGTIYFFPATEIAALRAEGHYTIAYTRQGHVFCPWSISQAEARLSTGFFRVHRSHLVNLAHVSGFARRKDSGTCFFEEVPSLEKVPVARSRVAELREALGL